MHHKMLFNRSAHSAGPGRGKGEEGSEMTDEFGVDYPLYMNLASIMREFGVDYALYMSLASIMHEFGVDYVLYVSLASIMREFGADYA